MMSPRKGEEAANSQYARTNRLEAQPFDGLAWTVRMGME